MEPREYQQKSFLQSFRWVSFFLMAFGLVFICVGLIMQVVRIGPENFNSYVNGVRQPYTESGVKLFRLVFLLAFGGVGLITLTIGTIILWRFQHKKRLFRRLKDEGVKIVAEVVEYSPSAVTVNRRHLMRLLCSYTTTNGQHYLFKSGLLRRDPGPYLTDDQVTIYYDRENMKRYFVDIDGSVGKVYEL
ncbi:hypothetical protein I6N95_01310 [Vagococcus sp. BWB3-3]|uniref:DUF3592 domain-containing protein n=1 Tax=Vagococcus allomyrinae TaxID=2794353 RepID=A0A940P237_9ENTE|nr:DUF3592 domain-containing protein [Vagococcus allomyrinae]MBP1039635.1 hypothetical protein [Vagococcus allomyrinae]